MLSIRSILRPAHSSRRVSIVRLVGGLFALLMAGSAHAIGDSGGCAMNRALIDAAATGPASAMHAHLASHMARAWKNLEPAMRTVLESSPRAIQEWQSATRKTFLNGSDFGCGEGKLLNHAIRGGNIDVVKWLVDEGADPSGMRDGLSPDSVFFRCPEAFARPGLTEAEATQRTEAIYRLLIDRGADKNRSVSHSQFQAANALTGCSSERMLRLMLQLGVDRSPQFGDLPALHAPLQEAVWSFFPGSRGNPEKILDKIRLLAEGGHNDLRGTVIEQRLHELCLRPAGEERCRKLQPVLKVSPGIWPGTLQTPISRPGPAAFAPRREVCSFPEIQFIDDLELAVVSHTGGEPTGLAFKGVPDEAKVVELIVNAPKRPVLLLLNSTGIKAPRIWSIRRTASTRIVGVILQRDFKPGARTAVLGLDPDTTIAQVRCDIPLDEAGPGRLLATPRPGSLDPFGRGLPFTSYFARTGAITVGEPLTPKARSSLSLSPEAGSSPLPLEPYAAAAGPLTGRAALEAMVANGSLSRADVDTFISWMGAVRRRPWPRNGLPKTVPAFWNAYVNKKDELRLPAGLRGADAPIIFTPAQTTIKGDIGDTTLFFGHDTNEPSNANVPRLGTCIGPRC